MSPISKFALRLAAQQRMRERCYGVSPPPMEPRINRRHVDGPYITTLDGQFLWLTPLERLLTKIGVWDAWDIEWRRFPLPQSTALQPKGEAK